MVTTFLREKKKQKSAFSLHFIAFVEQKKILILYLMVRSGPVRTQRSHGA